MKQMHVQTFESSSKSAWNFICSNEIIGKKFNLLTKNVVSNNCQWRVAAAAAAALSLVNVVVVTLDVGLSTVKKTTKKKKRKPKTKKKLPYTHTPKNAPPAVRIVAGSCAFLITRSKCFVCICFAVRWYRYRYRYYNYCFFGFCFTHTYTRTHTPTSKRGAQGIKSIFNTSLQKDISDLSCLCLCLYVCVQFTRFLLHSTLVN